MVHDLFLVKFFKLSSSVTFLLISVTACKIVQLNRAVTKSSFFVFVNSSPLHWQYLKLHWITPTQKGMLPLRLPSFFNSVGFKCETTKVVYIFLQNGNHCVHKILIYSSKWFPCKIFDFQSPANWKLNSFLIILQQKKSTFWYSRVCRNTHCLHWWPHIQQLFLPYLSQNIPWNCYLH